METENQNRRRIEETDKMNEKQKSLDISVVIPVYNEEENLKELYVKLSNVLRVITENFELIFLQNDPDDIPLLLKTINEGYDIVNGWRADRRDPFFSKKLPSKISNWLASKLTGVKLHDFGCTLKAFRREVVENMNLYGEMHRYIPALASWMGVSIAEVKVRHHPRQYGKSKYGITRLMRGMLDLTTVKFLLSYSTRPLQLFGIPGIISFIVGFVIGLYLTIGKLFFGMSLADRPLLLLAVLLIFLGTQFITMGLLGER
jgi:glycosyltransferase involved in cell wall biosynthesis